MWGEVISSGYGNVQYVEIPYWNQENGHVNHILFVLKYLRSLVCLFSKYAQTGLSTCCGQDVSAQDVSYSYLDLRLKSVGTSCSTNHVFFSPLLTQQLHGLLRFWTFWRWPHVTLASRHVSRPPSIKGLNMFELHPWVLSSIHSKHFIFFLQLSPSSHMLSTVKSWTYQKKIRWQRHASESHWAEPDLALMTPELSLQGN